MASNNTCKILKLLYQYYLFRLKIYISLLIFIEQKIKMLKIN